MLFKIDELLGRPWLPVGAFLCWVTGRSSLSVARLLANLITPSALFVYVFTERSTYFIGVVLYCVVISLLALALTIMTLGLIRGMEQGGDLDTRIISRAEETVIGARLAATSAWFYLLAVDGFSYTALAAFWMSGALYVASQNRPRRDHALKRAFRWIKQRTVIRPPGTTAPNPV